MSISSDPNVNEASVTPALSAPKPTRTACVYCGSARGNDPKFTEATTALGQAMAANGIRLVYGGGRVGLMGVVADAVMGAGGEVTGIIPEHIHERELQHTGLTELMVVDTMHTRKRLMADRSQAFIVLPGGFGTLDECFEIITWKQLELHNAPIVFLNIDGFWNKLLDLVDHQTESGFVSAANRKRMFSVAGSVEEAIAAIMAVAEQAPPGAEPDIR
jgi:uncharacterized protein (TIGR00730 family)